MMKSPFILHIAWLVVFIFFSSSLSSQSNCDTSFGSIDQKDNNCAPCVNGMEKLLDPLLQQHRAAAQMQSLNDAMNKHLDDKQARVDALMAKQNETDRVLKEWGIDDLNGQPAITEIEYLQNTIDEMRRFANQFPEQIEWMNYWIQQLESNVKILQKMETLTAKANALTNQIKNGNFGDLGKLNFDCCPDAITDGKFTTDQLAQMDRLNNELQALYDEYYQYRSELSDHIASMTQLLEAVLSQRAKEEKKAIERRDEYANGISGFLVSKMHSAIQTEFIQMLQQAGYPVGSAEASALEALSIAITTATGAMGSGGGMGGITGEAAEMIINAAMSDLSENDRKALAFISNAVISEIATAVINKVLQNAFTGTLSSFLLKGADAAAEGLGIPLMLFDRLMTIAPYLWEDKNRLILQGGFDRIILGLLQSIRLSINTGRFTPSGPLQAYMDALKGPTNKAVVICLPEQTIVPPTEKAMQQAFFKAAFPGQAVDALSSDDRFERKTDGNKTFLEYIPNNKMRFHIRFDCYCGNLTEKTTYTPSSVDPPWSNISLTGTEAKVLSVIPVKPSIGIVPILAGVVGIGTVVYVVVKEDDEDATPCNFTATATTTQPTCGLSNGSITIVTEPAGMHHYHWAHGPDQQMISSLAPGNYMVTITQANTTCTQVLSNTLTDQSTFTVTASTQPSSCDQPDGSATIQVTPQGAYTFVWSTGSTEQNQTQLAAGQYTVTVSNSASCTRSIDVVIGSTPFEPTLTFTTTPSSCGQSDGTIQVTVDPSAAYDYNWSGGQSGAQIANVSAGNYTVTVSIPGTSCSKTGETTVDELPASFTLTTTTTPSTCGLSDGTATVTADPPGPYTIVWSDGQTTEQATGLLPGNYSVTVTLQGTTCSQNISVTVDELPVSFTLTTTTTPAACGAADGTATVVVNPSGAYSYVWSSGHNTEQATALAAGTYTVTVSIPGTNCAQSISVAIDQLPPAFTLSFTSTPANCGQGDGTATVTPDPPGEYTYAWPGGENTPSVSGLSAGIYEVTVSTGDTACQQVTQVVIDQEAIDISVFTSSTPSGCGTADGTASIDSINGADGFAISITWQDGQTGMTATGLTSGNYTVTITLQAGKCFAEYTDTVTVDQVQANFTGTITTTPADCGIANGTATIVVVPDGAYTLLWSDQQTGPVLQNVMAGSYSVVVTDANSCTAIFTTDIAQLPVEHITITGTTPGNCTGGGDISFTLVTNGAGPLVVEVISAEGTISFTIAPGNYVLSAFTTVFPGAYSLNVYDQGAGAACTESDMTTVQDVTPPLIAADDFYVTESETPVDGNMLDNDSGLDPEVTGISTVVGGTVIFTASGDFTFTPDPGFTGDGMFTYTVTDACGNAATAIVTITVESVECNFTIATFITHANCGIANGAIQIEVMPAGNYAFSWNTGDTSSELTDIEAGGYTVTIEDVSLGCELVFDIEVEEYPAEYISDIIITQPTCTTPGEIQFTINTQGDVDFLTMSVTHPNGSDVFVVEPGVLRLSDYVAITAGEYTVEIFIGNAGPECIESFTADIAMVQSITIFEEAVFPPSSPSGMDGGAIVIVSPPGDAPYMILLNGVPYGTSPGEIVQINGLGVGTYTVQIVDASGCESNEIIIMVPFPDIILAFGMGVHNVPADASNPEHTPIDEGWVNSTWMSVDYRVGNVPQRMRITYIAPSYIHRDHTASRLRGDYTLPIAWKPGDRFAMVGSAGIGMDNFHQRWNAHAMMEGEVRWQVGKKMSVHGLVNTLLGDQAPLVTWSVNIVLPF